MNVSSKSLFAALAFFGIGIITGKFIFSNSHSESQEPPPSSSSSSPRLSSPPLLLTQESLEQHSENLDDQRSLTEDNFSTLATVDPEQALTQALALPLGLIRDRTVLAILDQWASSNSLAVFQWIDHQQDKVPQLAQAYSLVMAHHIQQHPQSAASLISAMTPGDMKSALAAQLSEKLAENNPQAAFAWTKTLTDSNARQQAATTALQTMAKTDQQAAFDLALSENDPTLRDHLLDHVGLVMARSAPEETAAQLDSFPKSVHAKIINHVAESWASSNPGAASTWIEQLPSGSLRDSAIQRSLSHFSSHDPQQAFTLASSVNDQARRYGLIRDVLLTWYGTDPEQSEQALANTSGLSSEQREFLAKDIRENAPVNDFVIPQGE